MVEEITADTPPIDLRVRGLRFWREVLEVYELRPDEIAILAATCRQLDDIARLEAALRDAPTVVFNRSGGQVPNPLFAQVRSARLAYARLASQLRLDEAGEPNSATAAGRALVSQRRDRKSGGASPRFEVVSDG